MNLYDDLGVPNDATPEEIKAAYRKQAKAKHPDAGGDAETFGALTKAYDVLSDPRSRARYDETGNAEPLDDIEKRAETIIGELFTEMLRRAEAQSPKDSTGLPLITSNLVKEICAAIKHGQSKIAAMKKAAEKKKRHYERLRLKVSGKVMERIIDHEIRSAAREIDNAEQEHLASERAAEMLADYTHTPDDMSEEKPTRIISRWMSDDPNDQERYRW